MPRRNRTSTGRASRGTGSRRWRPSKCREFGDVREARMPPVTIGENRAVNRPRDANRRIVPRDADLALRVVNVRALVLDLRHVAHDGKAVREAPRDVALLEVGGRQRDTNPLAERGRHTPEIDRDAEDTAL